MFRGFGKKDKSKTQKSAPPAPSVSKESESAAGKTASSKVAQVPVLTAMPEADKFEKLTLLNAISLKDVSPSDQPKLFRKHLQLCQQRFDFTTGTDMKEKESKRLLLLGLVDYVNNPNTKLHESEFPDIIAMVSANIFRALPPRTDFLTDIDEDEPVVENAWPHLQIVYEFLLRFIVSGDVEPKVAKKYLSHAFILNLLELFNSEDPRERDYLKTILHRVYGKLMATRAFIRKAIANVFMGAIYLNDRHNGIAELLEILGSIINGFALPLKVEHKRFLTNCLIPLHKVKYLAAFHQQLEYCICQFVEKDNQQATQVVLGLLRFWPQINSPKQVQFIHELEEVLELTQAQEFRQVVGPLFKQVSLCLDSQHFQVAERTLLLWNNEYIYTLITQCRSQVLPIVYDVLKKNSEVHWNSNVMSLTQSVLKSFQDSDRSLCEEVAKASKIREEKARVDHIRRSQLWDQLLLAKDSSQTLTTADTSNAVSQSLSDAFSAPIPPSSSSSSTVSAGLASSVLSSAVDHHQS